MNRWAAVVVGVVAFAVVAYLVRGPGASDVASAADGGAAPEAGEVELPAPVGPLIEAGESADEQRLAVASELVEVPSTEVADPGSVLLRVVAAEGEREFGDLSGRVQLDWTESDGYDQPIWVEVRDGRAAIELAAGEPRPTLLRVFDAELGGRAGSGRRAYANVVASPADETLVGISFYAEQRLVVRDAETGEGLTGVLVVDATGIAQGLEHPGPIERLDVLAGPTPSPVTLEVPQPEMYLPVVPLFVTAAGHGWKRIEVDPYVGGARVVELAPAGALSIEVPGAEDFDALELTLRAAESGRAVGRMELSHSGPHLWNGVDAGDWRLELGRGGQALSGPLVSQDVRVEVDRTTNAVLEIPTDVARVAERFDVRLTVNGPSGFAEDALEVGMSIVASREGNEFEGRFELASTFDDGTEQVFEGVLTDLPRGIYLAQLSEFGSAHRLDVESGAAQRITLGEVREVVLRTVDAATGEPVAASFVSSMSRTAEGFPGEQREVDTDGAEDGVYRIETFAPRLMIMVAGPNGSVQTLDVQVEGPITEAVAEFGSEAKFRFRFEVDGSVIVPPRGWRPEPEALDGDGEQVAVASSSTFFEVHVSQPGRYRITLPEVEGFEALEPVELTAVAGRTTTHVVRLVRRL